VLFLLLLALLLFRASLRTRCKSERASKHVNEPVPRLQNGLFLALRMLRRQECRKDSRCSVNIYERLRKSIQARILTTLSYYVSNAFFTRHEVVRIIQLTFLKSCSVHFPAFDTILIFATFKNYSNWSYKQIYFQKLSPFRYYSYCCNWDTLNSLLKASSSIKYQNECITQVFIKIEILD